jgi:hypothetical protein
VKDEPVGCLEKAFVSYQIIAVLAFFALKAVNLEWA